jgi:hypothetical protein
MGKRLNIHLPAIKSVNSPLQRKPDCAGSRVALSDLPFLHRIGFAPYRRRLRSSECGSVQHLIDAVEVALNGFKIKIAAVAEVIG